MISHNYNNYGLGSVSSKPSLPPLPPLPPYTSPYTGHTRWVLPPAPDIPLTARHKFRSKNLQRKVGNFQTSDKIIGGTRQLEMINRFTGFFAKKARFSVTGTGGREGSVVIS